MYTEGLERLREINEARDSFTGVQQVIDELGEDLLPDKFPGPEIFGDDAISRFERMAQYLIDEGYPVVVHVLRGEKISSISLDVVDTEHPDEYARLFGFHIGNPGGAEDDLGLDLLMLHKRHRGAEYLLQEIFGPME